MAQIIKHRRGSLESVGSATKRAGELLVVTGSSGITATNGNSILFVGIDGSTVTPANKILQGSTVPNLTGAAYDTSIDGIPYYDTSAQKLYILNKGGNVEIKATANTGGTGIVSGSSQVIALLPTDTVSGSSQITISSTTGYTDFSSSLNSRLVTASTNVTELFSTASDHETRIDSIENSIGGASGIGLRVSSLEAFSGSQETKDSTLATYTGSVNTSLTALNSFSSSEETKNSTLATYTGSVNTSLTALNSFSSSEETKNSTLATYTGSVNTRLTELYTTASNHETRVDSLEASQSVFDTAFNVVGTDVEIVGNLVVKGSTTSVESTTIQLGDNIIELNGSAVANGGLFVKDATAPNTATGSLLWDSTNDYWKAGISGSESKLLRAVGDSVVSGSSQITISSTTGYSDFSSSLTAKDTELFGTASDHETRIDSIETSIGGASGIGQRVSSLEAFSGSQETKDSTLATYTGSVNTSLTALNSFSSSEETKNSTLATYTGSVNTSLTALNSFSSSEETKNSTLATYTGSVNTRLTELYTTASNHETRVDSLEASQSVFDTAFNVVGTDVEIVGNLVVKGSTTSVESTTIQLGDNIIELNGSAVANGGLFVKDATAPNTATGSLLWDSTNDYWKAGISGSESKLLRAVGDSVVSGSSQITISSTTGYSDFSSSLTAKDTELFGTASDHETRIDSIETSIGGASGIGQRVSSLEAFSGSQETKDSTLGTYTGSIDTKFSTLGTYTGSVDTNLSNLNSFSSSIVTTIKTKLNADGVISGSSQVSYTGLSNIPGGIISGSSQLNSTTITGLNLTNVSATGSFSGSFIGNGSGLTGIATSLVISGSVGNHIIDLKNEALTIEGLGPVTASVIGADGFTIAVSDATTSSKGIASFDADDFSVTTGNVSIKSAGVRAVNLNADVAGTGLSLDGVDNSLEVDFGSTAGTSVEGNTSLTVQGTTNEISVSGGSITLGSGGTVTIGLPDSVTIPTASIQNDLSVGRNLTVDGNLYVNGTTTTIDSTTIQLGDNIIELNGNAGANGGLLVKDSTNPNVVSGSLLWDSTNDYWKGGALGSEKEFARLNATPTSGSVQVIGANGLLVDSDISDDGTNVTIGSELIINGLTANTFVVSNGSKKLISVAPSNAGDLIQWNGSSFVASNEIDGGTF